MKTFKAYLFLLIVFTTSVYSQIKPNKYFSKYFEFVKEIKLPGNILVADISFMDTYEDKIVFADKIGKNAYIINTKGELIKKLNPDECHPGITWRPHYVYFNKKGDVLVRFSAPPWGFFFTKEGKCIGPADNQFLGAQWFAFLNENTIIGYNTHNKDNTNSLILMDPKGKPIKTFGVFPEAFENMIVRRDGGGLITDINDNLYQLNVSSYEITKYDRNGNYNKTLKTKPFKYIPPQKDFSKTNDISRLMYESKHIGEFSNALRLYLLSDEILALELWTEGILELALFDLEGNRINKSPINYQKDKSLYAKSGYLYFPYQPPADKHGGLPNPILKVYKFKSNMRGK